MEERVLKVGIVFLVIAILIGSNFGERMTGFVTSTLDKVTARQVGVGTANPEEKLHIYSADSGAKIVAETEGTGLGDNAYLVLKTPETRTSDVQFWVGDEGRFRIARHQDNYLTLGAFRDGTWQEDLNVMPDGNVTVAGNLYVDDIILFKRNPEINPEGIGLPTPGNNFVGSNSYDDFRSLRVNGKKDVNVVINDQMEYSDAAFNVFNNAPGAASLLLFKVGTEGDVGIGTTTPEEKLHIYSADSGAKIVAETEGTGLGDNAYLVLKTPETRTSDVQFWVGDEGRFRIARHQDNYLTLGAFRDGTWQEDLNVMPDGRVGIGTSNPESTLHISDTEARVRLNSETISANSGINFQNVGNIENRWQIGKVGSNGASDANNFYIRYYDGISWKRPFEITNTGSVSMSGLTGSGNAYVCVSSNGGLYRSVNGC